MPDWLKNMLTSKGDLQEALDPATPKERLEELCRKRSSAYAEAVAQNPNAPPELLEKLSKREGLQKLISKNPNAPLPLLYRLWVQHPSGLLENPSLPLWLLESPQFWGALPYSVLNALLRLPQLSSELLQTIWGQLPNDSLRGFIVEHPNAPVEILEAAFKKPSLFAPLAKNPKTPEPILKYLIGVDAYDARDNAAKNPSLSRAFVKLASRLKDSSIDSSLTPDDLTELSQSGLYLQRLIAKHPNTPGEALCRFAQQSDWTLLQSVAKHPNTPRETVLFLLREKAEICGEASLSRPDVTPEFGRILLEKNRKAYGIYGALRALASHPVTSQDVLFSLAQQHTSSCWELIIKRPDFTPALLRAAASYSLLPHQEEILSRSDIDAEALRILASSPHEKIRARVAAHPKSPPKALVHLFVDREEKIREAAAAHPNLPPLSEVLATLCTSRDARHRQIVLDRPDAPEAVLLQLFNGDPSLREKAIVHANFPATLRASLEKAKQQAPLSHEEETLLAQSGPYGQSLLDAYQREPIWLFDDCLAGKPLSEQIALLWHPLAPEVLKRWFCLRLEAARREQPLSWVLDVYLQSCSMEEKHFVALLVPLYPLSTVFFEKHPERIKVPAPAGPTPASPLSRQEALLALQSAALMAPTLERLMMTRDTLVRRLLAARPEAPLIFLVSVAFGHVLGEQLALLRNPALPAPFMRWLCKHPNAHLREKAKQRWPSAA